MLEVGRKYSKPEMTAIFGTKDKQGLDRKLKRYGVVFESSGRGEKAVYDIKALNDPFKVFAITELGCDGNTDCRKLRDFYYHFFNDEVFAAMPDEVKESWLDKWYNGNGISRKTIAGYTKKLDLLNWVYRHSSNYIYYFAFRQKQRIVEKAEYSKAWSEYWNALKNGVDYYIARNNMIVKYGGMARKQPIPERNGIYNKEVEYMLTLIQQSMENELGD